MYSTEIPDPQLALWGEFSIIAHPPRHIVKQNTTSSEEKLASGLVYGSPVVIPRIMKT